MRLEQAGPGVSRDGNHPVDGWQGRVRVGGGSRRAICSRCASRAAVLRPAARGAAFFSPRCFRHWRRFGEKLVARRIDDHPFGWCFYFGNGDVPFVGADAYPQGTGSGSRSYLAGRHWPPAARNHAGNEATPLVAEGHDFVRRGGGPYGVGRYRVLCNRPRRWASTGSRRAEVFAPCGGKRFRLPFTVPRCPIAPSSVTARWAVPPSPQGEGGA